MLDGEHVAVSTLCFYAAGVQSPPLPPPPPNPPSAKVYTKDVSKQRIPCILLCFFPTSLKVLGLTLPTLDSPRVRGCERTACTVEWTSSFLTQGQDQTKLGFNVSFVPAVIGDGSLTAGDGRGGGFLEVGGTGCSAW